MKLKGINLPPFDQAYKQTQIKNFTESVKNGSTPSQISLEVIAHCFTEIKNGIKGIELTKTKEKNKAIKSLIAKELGYVSGIKGEKVKSHRDLSEIFKRLIAMERGELRRRMTLEAANFELEEKYRISEGTIRKHCAEYKYIEDAIRNLESDNE